jgi:hypothetical protein
MPSSLLVLLRVLHPLLATYPLPRFHSLVQRAQGVAQQTVQRAQSAAIDATDQMQQQAQQVQQTDQASSQRITRPQRGSGTSP